MPRWYRYAILGLSAVALLVLAGTGFWGWEQGRASALMLNESRVSTLLEQMDEDIEAGRIRQAVVIGNALSDSGVLDWQRLEQVRILRLKVVDQAESNNGDEAPPLPTQVPRSAAFVQAEVAFARGEWGMVIDHLTQLRKDRPDSVDVGYIELLEQTYIQWARELVQNGHGEEALLQLEVAKGLRLSQEVSNEIKAAQHYQTSQSYWDTNWPLAIDEMRQIYAWDPEYADTSSRLEQAIRLFRDRAIWHGDSCLAFLYFDTVPGLLKELELEHIGTELQQRCSANGT